MRIRTIKPEFYRSEDIAALPRDVRLLFIGLWSYVDDNGVGIDDYRQIAADLFALEEDPKETRDWVRESLATLSRVSLTVHYKVDGRAYLFIPSWDRHQKIDKPGKIRYPRPPADYTPPTSDDDPDGDHVARPSRDLRETPGPGTGEQGNRGTGEQGNSSSPISAIKPAGEATPAEPPREDVEALCTRLRDRMIANGFKPPTITADWRQQARLLIDKDGRDLTQALRLLDWATADEFWHPNIKSMGKFRTQYDTLLARARQQQQQRRAAAGDDRITGWQALKQTGTEPHLRALPGGEPC